MAENSLSRMAAHTESGPEMAFEEVTPALSHSV